MTKLPLLPPPYQLGFVVKNLRAAIHYWSSVLGVGPFFLIKPAFEAQYRGVPTNPDVEVAISYWGELQLELIQQHDDSPSPYRTFLDAGLEGLHHTSSVVDDLEAGLAVLAEHGKPVVFRGSASGFRFTYAVEDEHAGTVVELIENSKMLEEFLAVTKKAVREWDGKDPIRRLG
jgi:catechol 2,3-dioxygenase-like lactoylglutathione lyase family enzyme